METFVKQTSAVFLLRIKLLTRKERLLQNFTFTLLLFSLLLTLFPILEFLSYFYIILLPFAVNKTIRSQMMMIVNEKKDKQKEIQLIMGLRLGSYYLGWVSSCLFLTCISSLLYLLMFAISQINLQYLPRPFKDELLFFTLYQFYCFACVGQMLFVSSFFEDGKKATNFYAILCFIIHIFTSPKTLDLGTMIFPQNLMIEFLAEQYFHTSKSGISISTQLLILLLQGTVQILLYICIDQIIPHLNYDARINLFLLLKLFRRQKKQIENIEEELEMFPQQLGTGSKYLRNQKNENTIIKIYQLTKSYNGNAVVNHLSLNLQKNQIFCLLGHNGAGKSTTLHLICGLIDKDSGNITVNNQDINTNLSEIRQHFGFCTQKDVIFLELSVYDHLKYYGSLKLIKNESLSEEVESVLAICQLQQEKHQLGMHLNGGGKRKLCLAIALMGNSSVLLLDEPTTGLDPFSRTQVWNILREAKKNRCIILTTHYLDEAEELADKIGIIQSGHFSFYGTVKQIKRQFSVGYNIFIECQEETNTKQILDQISSKINSLYNTEFKYQVQNRCIRFNIPFENTEYIAQVLEYLEKNKEIDLSFQTTSLEDAYIKLHSLSDSSQGAQSADINYRDIFQNEIPQYHFLKQLKGLFLRRLWIGIQNKGQYLLQGTVWILLIYIFIGFESLTYFTFIELNVIIKVILFHHLLSYQFMKSNKKSSIP